MENTRKFRSPSHTKQAGRRPDDLFWLVSVRSPLLAPLIASPGSGRTAVQLTHIHAPPATLRIGNAIRPMITLRTDKSVTKLFGVAATGTKDPSSQKTSVFLRTREMIFGLLLQRVGKSGRLNVSHQHPAESTPVAWCRRCMGDSRFAPVSLPPVWKTNRPDPDPQLASCAPATARGALTGVAGRSSADYHPRLFNRPFSRKKKKRGVAWQAFCATTVFRKKPLPVIRFETPRSFRLGENVWLASFCGACGSNGAFVRFRSLSSLYFLNRIVSVSPSACHPAFRKTFGPVFVIQFASYCRCKTPLGGIGLRACDEPMNERLGGQQNHNGRCRACMGFYLPSRSLILHRPN